MSNIANEQSAIKAAKPIIWTIAGADCSGGAGIAADIKTGHNLGVEVCHLITANTVQNSLQLSAIYPVATTVLNEQAQLLLTDKPPQAIKVGLLANDEQVQWLTRLLKQLKSNHAELKVIFDPVGQATVGGQLSQVKTKALLPLLPLIDILTPNVVEALQLSGLASTNTKTLAQALLKLGVSAVIIKGGHNSNELALAATEHRHTGYGSDDCTDSCMQEVRQQGSVAQLEYVLSSPKINSHYSHGGGCSFATAITSFISHGHLLRDAFTLTKAFINQGLRAQAGKVDHYGAFEQQHWPSQAADFPTVHGAMLEKYQQLTPFKSLNLKEDQLLGLYPVIDSLTWLERLLPLNLNIIQLRLKNKAPAELEALIKRAVFMAQQSKTRLFINDHWQLAIKYSAYGVHIGQEDLASADLSALHRAGLRLGISTHGCYEFLLAQQLRPSYLAIGAIFPTKTKDMTGQIQGITNLNNTLALRSEIPVVAIGGINLQRAKQVWQTKVDSIAVVTAITEAKSPEQAVADFQTILS